MMPRKSRNISHLLGSHFVTLYSTALTVSSLVACRIINFRGQSSLLCNGCREVFPRG